MKKNGVLIFIKYPFLGDVKSRLSIKFGENLTVTLYKKFVQDLLEMLKKTNYPVLICFFPPDRILEFKKWLGNNYEFIPQVGINLGERLKNCFIKGFELGYNNLIVIGSDSPDIPEKIIHKSIEKLNDNDIVIGPSEDGGYYLIGFTDRSFTQRVFEDITWSSASVFEETVDKLKSGLKKIYILEKWYDVDTIEDLKKLYKKNVNTDFKTSETMNFLKNKL